MSDERYNGWTNYPTWAVNLWLANDEGLYLETREIVRDTIAANEGTANGGQTLTGQTAGRIRDWVMDDLSPNLAASFVSDLLGWAFAQVDWREIAASWIEDENEAAA